MRQECINDFVYITAIVEWWRGNMLGIKGAMNQ